jgi:integrase
MRPSEYLALKWSDIEWARGTASVSRTIQVAASGWTFYHTKRKRSRRVVKLQNFVLEALDKLRGQRAMEHDLVFHEGGQPLRQRKITVEFRCLLAAAGIRSIRLYDLRHTAAIVAVAAGVSVKVISDQLGHASISFTLERYSHVLPSIQDEAAAKVERMLMG